MKPIRIQKFDHIRPSGFRYINHILDGPRGPIKEKDFNSVVSAISATQLGLDVLYEFLSTNLNRTLNELSDGQGTVTHIYSVLTSKVTKDSDIAKVSPTHFQQTFKITIKNQFECTRYKKYFFVFFYDAKRQKVKQKYATHSY